MNKVSKLSVSFTADQVDMVKASVKSGEYGSVSEVVRDALREWNENRIRKKAELEYLRNAYKQGIESGSGQFADIEDLLIKARNQLSK